MILRQVQNKSQHTSPIVAGPKPIRQKGAVANQTSQEFDHTSPFYDPWAGWKGTSQSRPMQVPQQARDVAGPTEAKFKEQEARISAIEQKMTKLQQDTAAGFQQVEARDHQNQAHMKEAIHNVKQEIESSFTAAINLQSQQLNQTLADLKAMLQSNPKRPRDRGNDEEMDEP